MTALGWATLVAVCGFVWGGFVGLVWRAVRAERGKREAQGVDEPSA